MLVGQTIGSGTYRFEIEQELGSGAMGTVYRAKFHKDGKIVPVALKVVALGLLGNEGAMARFEREANILKQLRHPHIVKLYATGHYRKTPFIAMEFIDGEALDRVLARRGRLTWEEVVAYGKQLCEALQYAHDKGIIHRDLKPSNLMITTDGTLKLTDFGIAKDTDVTALTGQNSTIGTAAYMSPEQCKGDRNLTNKSDLYSLGVVFFELLAGKKPFYAETTVDMFLKHVNEPPPRLGKLVNDLPPKLESLILQLMEKDKDDRPIDAAWVGRMLQEIEEDAFTRKSAGLDAVTSRRTDKTRNLDGSKRDEADREAARALRGKKKKSKKTVAVPLWEQKWFQAAGLALVLVALATGAYLALRPPSAEKLFAAIEAAGAPDARLEAATKYLEQYGNVPSDLTDKAATVFREATVRKREEQLTKRFLNKLSKPDEGDDPGAYAAAWDALEAERAGRLKEAEDHWLRVKSAFPAEAALPFTLKEDVLAKARWGWVADKRIADLKRVSMQLTSLREEIVDKRRFVANFTYEPGSPQLLAVKGLRLEEFGDRDKAARVWDQLITTTERDPDRRDWYLLACQQRAAIPKSSDDAVAMRQSRITKAITEATEIANRLKSNPQESVERLRLRQLCREVIDLYDDEVDPEISAAVKKARQLLTTIPKN
jgi:serine/threonine-protein kinase